MDLYDEESIRLVPSPSPVSSVSNASFRSNPSPIIYTHKMPFNSPEKQQFPTPHRSYIPYEATPIRRATCFYCLQNNSEFDKNITLQNNTNNNSYWNRNSKYLMIKLRQKLKLFHRSR